jgi:hypothetical protein
MASNVYESPAALLAEMKNLRAGLPNLPAAITQVTADGETSTIPQIEAEMDGIIAVYQAEKDAEIALQKATKAREDLAVTAIPRYEAIRASLKTMIGKKNPDLTKIGLEPDRTPAPLTVDQKKTKVSRALATRKARGTMGPKQKAKIKGSVPAETPSPTPSPEPPGKAGS